MEFVIVKYNSMVFKRILFVTIEIGCHEAEIKINEKIVWSVLKMLEHLDIVMQFLNFVVFIFVDFASMFFISCYVKILSHCDAIA